jgi:Arc/MetJ-type ribon-helix-helix transcriptional regulator
MNVKLTPFSEHLLRDHLARGVYHSPEEIIERALQVLAEQEKLGERRSSHQRQSREEFELFLNGLATYSDKIPSMPGETFSREMIYQDHD